MILLVCVIETVQQTCSGTKKAQSCEKCKKTLTWGPAAVRKWRNLCFSLVQWSGCQVHHQHTASNDGLIQEGQNGFMTAIDRNFLIIRRAQVNAATHASHGEAVLHSVADLMFATSRCGYPIVPGKHLLCQRNNTHTGCKTMNNWQQQGKWPPCLKSLLDVMWPAALSTSYM